MEITTEETESIVQEVMRGYTHVVGCKLDPDVLRAIVEKTIDLVEEAMQAKTEQLAAKFTAHIADVGPGIALTVSPAALDRGLHWLAHKEKANRDFRRDLFESIKPVLEGLISQLDFGAKARPNGRDPSPPSEPEPEA